MEQFLLTTEPLSIIVFSPITTLSSIVTWDPTQTLFPSCTEAPMTAVGWIKDLPRAGLCNALYKIKNASLGLSTLIRVLVDFLILFVVNTQAVWLFSAIVSLFSSTAKVKSLAFAVAGLLKPVMSV